MELDRLKDIDIKETSLKYIELRTNIKVHILTTSVIVQRLNYVDWSAQIEVHNFQIHQLS